ncbi:MoaD/ThiS family protein [Candidatus Bathyarchaeota archaeon]|nr:MoaD/ThiS family protein [Candidatus Bathyarchaeota archaeon]
MFPGLTVVTVEEETTLRQLVGGLGRNYLYAFDKGVIGVTVNGKRLWPSAVLKKGDKVVIYPIITGG